METKKLKLPLSDEEFERLWKACGEAQERRFKKAQEEYDSLSDEEKKKRQIEDQWLDRFCEDWTDD